jgi:hypothetical protein
MDFLSQRVERPSLGQTTAQRANSDEDEVSRDAGVEPTSDHRVLDG